MLVTRLLVGRHFYHSTDRVTFVVPSWVVVVGAVVEGVRRALGGVVWSSGEW